MNRRTRTYFLIPAFASSVFSKLLAVALIPALTVGVLFSGVQLQAESAGSLYKHGQAAEAREDYDTAFNNYQKANKLAPKELRYRAALYRVRVPASALHLGRARKLDQAGDTSTAIIELLRAAEIDPSNEAVQQELVRLRTKAGESVVQSDVPLAKLANEGSQVSSIDSPIALKPLSNEPLTLHMTEDAKVVYQAVGKAAGVNILFDPDFISKRVQVDLNNVSLMNALRIVGTMSNTFWRPITANTIFVAQNTRQKRSELDEQAVQTFYLTNAWQQNDMNDVQTALRNVMPNAKVFGVASQNAIIMRGTPDELLLAQKLVDDLDRARAEVVVDIAIMEVSKTWERQLGLSWPTSASVALQSTSTTTSSTSDTTVKPTFNDLANLKSGNFAVTVGSATLNMLLSDANTKILQSPRIRATDAQKATMKIGSRIPIATGSYSSGTTTSSVSGLVNTQFQYQDIGVNIEMTPTIHYDRDVTMKIKIEVSSHTSDQTISGVTEPVISQRVIDQVIRLREGEASILGGIQDNEDAKTWSGFPGLSSIPILKYFFGSKDSKITNDEVVFVVVPHIVRSSRLDPSNLRPIDTGNGQSIELRRNEQAPTSVPVLPAVAPIARPVAPVAAPIQASSAAAAVPAALAQLQQAAEASPAHTPAPAPASGLSFVLATPPANQLVNGGSFQVPILLNNGSDISSVPLQLHYDPAKLALANVSAGNLLNRDGQAVALVHRDDGPGNLTVVVSRPPGTTGINGSGTLCVLTFQAKTAGATTLAFTRAGAITSAQQSLTAPNVQLNVQIK